MTDRPPAEGRTDIDVPGADVDTPSERRDIGDEPDSTERERRDQLADRVGVGTPSAAGQTNSDVLPDVEVPEEQA